MAKSNGKRVRRRIWIGLAILAIAGIGFTVARPKAKAEDEKGKIKTAKAEVADVQVRVTEVGSVEPQVKVDVKSVLSGKVVELLVREGDRVKRGQVLARVEPDVNQARDLAQVKNAVAEADIALSRGEGHARAQRRPARPGPALGPGRPRERDPLPPGQGQPTTPRWTSTASSRRAACRSPRSRPAITQRLNVASPMDGVVIRRPVELGDTVMSGVSSFNAGTVLMTVADVETMIIKAGINEVDIGKVRLEQPVKVGLDAYPKVRFAGTIKRIAPAARLEEKVKVFDVEIAIDRQGNELRTGMTANIDVVGEKRAKVLTVPVEAIFKKDDDRGRLRQEGRGAEAGRQGRLPVLASSPRARRTRRPKSSIRRTPGRRSSSSRRSRPASRASTRWRS